MPRCTGLRLVSFTSFVVVVYVIVQLYYEKYLKPDDYLPPEFRPSSAVMLKKLRKLKFKVKQTCSNEDRLFQLSHQCEKQMTSQLNYSSLSDKLLVDDVKQSIYCKIPRTAPQVWKSLLTESKYGDNGKVDKRSRSDTSSGRFKKLNSYKPEEIDARLRSYFKYIIVRHPLERLTSFYEDYIITDSSHGNGVQKVIYDHYDLDRKKTISFKRFVQYVLEEPQNSYWSSLESNFHSCQIQYDYVAKLETFHKDFQQLITRAQISPTSAAKKFSPTQSGSVSKKLDQISSLSSRQLKRLELLYENDMKMFGYVFDFKKHMSSCATDVDDGLLCC